MTTFENVCACLLFFMESYLILGHLMTLFRIRMLPRKDLVRLRIYFFIDLATTFCSSFLFLHKLRWLVAIQIVQHLYYVVFWEQTNPAKKIVSWSSLDWMESDFAKEWHLEAILGTLFDIVVHILMAYHLGHYLNTVQIMTVLVMANCFLILVVRSPRFAWSSPNSEKPKWIEKRIQPVPIEKARFF